MNLFLIEKEKFIEVINSEKVNSIIEKGNRLQKLQSFMAFMFYGIYIILVCLYHI